MFEFELKQVHIMRIVTNVKRSQWSVYICGIVWNSSWNSWPFIWDAWKEMFAWNGNDGKENLINLSPKDKKSWHVGSNKIERISFLKNINHMCLKFYESYKNDSVKFYLGLRNSSCWLIGN